LTAAASLYTLRGFPFCRAARGRHEGRQLLEVAKKRDTNCRIVRRKGRVYVINKTNPRFKARQG